MFNLAVELYREINFSHSESWGNKKRKRWKETFEIFYILSVISNVISTFSSTVVGYGFISDIHIHKLEYSIFSAKIIQVPYGKDFIAMWWTV